MGLNKLTKIIRENLSDKRFEHSLNVADEAKKLAQHYKNADAKIAYIAGLLHDIAKEFPKDKNLLLIKNRSDVCPVELLIPQLYHAPAGACYIEHKLLIDDYEDDTRGDILNAVRYHTTGRAEMSPLEEIVYLADLISLDRQYDDLKHMRKLAYKNTDKAMIYALNFCIKDALDENSMLPKNAINAYNYYMMKKLTM